MTNASFQLSVKKR